MATIYTATTTPVYNKTTGKYTFRFSTGTKPIPNPEALVGELLVLEEKLFMKMF